MTELKQKAQFTPYEGSSPYLFISYAHKDIDRVEPYLEQLQERRYRFWYDEWIDPSTEFWTEVIAEHLTKAAFVLLFMSDNAAKSKNVKRELTFTQNEDISMITVFLEETALTPGLKLQLGAGQQLYSYKYDSMELFLPALFRDKLFEKVQEVSEEPAATEPVMNRPAAKDERVYVEKMPYKINGVSGNYTGHIVNGKPDDPKGEMVYRYGTRFVGSYEKGIRNGYGTCYNDDGTIRYQGHWKDGQFIGDDDKGAP